MFEQMKVFAGAAKLLVLATLLKGGVALDEALRLSKLTINLGGNV